MKKAIINLLFVLSAIVITSQLSAATEPKEYTILLPINHVSEKKTTLSVTIDKNYKPLQKLPAKFMEFIPEGDDDNRWSQIITLQTLVGSYISAAEFLNKIKAGMKSKVPSTKILEEESTDKGSYQVASFGATYEINGRKEVVYMRYFSGPADLCGIQFAKPLSPNESPEEKLTDLKDFVDKISNVVSGD